MTIGSRRPARPATATPARRLAQRAGEATPRPAARLGASPFHFTPAESPISTLGSSNSRAATGDGDPGEHGAGDGPAGQPPIFNHVAAAATAPPPSPLRPPAAARKGWIMSAEGGGLGLVSGLGHTAQLWKRETGSDGAATWLLTKTIRLDQLLPQRAIGRLIIDFSDENNMLILRTIDGTDIFTLHTESMECKKLPVNFRKLPVAFRPLSSVYTAAMGFGAQHAGAELLHN